MFVWGLKFRFTRHVVVVVVDGGAPNKKPSTIVTTTDHSSGPGWAKDAGVYEFTMGATGDKVLARYSFVYVYEDGVWKIAHHHSSVMPEALLAKNEGEVLAEGEVRALFKLWNDALATGDPAIVANRYAKDAILLPTVSGKSYHREPIVVALALLEKTIYNICISLNFGFSQ